MFDIGFSELLVIAVVALLVLGPERLPKAARFAGLWVRRARQQWYSVKSEFERDLAADELQRSLRETRESLRQAEDQIRTGATAFQTQIEQGFDEAAAAMPPAPLPGAEGSEAAPGDATAPDAGDAHATDPHAVDAHTTGHDPHEDEDLRPLGSTLEPLYEPEPPIETDDDDAPPQQPTADHDAHAGR
jgi:sec-independent protein translocase protein TatB